MMSELKHCQPKTWTGPLNGPASIQTAPSAVARRSALWVEGNLTTPATVLGAPDERIRPLGVDD